MLLAYAVFPQPRHDLARHFVHDFFIFLFAFKIEVGTVVIHHGRISFDDVTTVFIQPYKVFAEVLLQDIHKPEDMVVSERWLLIVCSQIVPGGMLGLWVQYPGINKEAGYGIAVISDLPVCSLIFEKLFQKSPFITSRRKKYPILSEFEEEASSSVS